jgi:integrase
VEHGYLHGFRHTNATIMEYIGVPPKYANQCGGWADDHVRQKTYTDLMTAGGEETAQKVDSFFLALTSPKTDKKLPD